MEDVGSVRQPWVWGGIDFFNTAKEAINQYFPAFIEGMAANYLKQKFIRSGFYQNKGEIDFIGLDKKETFGFEVKAITKNKEKEIEKLKKLNQFHRIMLISKNEFRESQGILIIPYWMLLLAD